MRFSQLVRAWWCPLFLLLALPVDGQADAIVVTRAMKASTVCEILVEEDGVRLQLEIGIADFPAFRNLLPDPLLERLEGEAAPLVERVTRFLAEDWLFEADGAPLTGRFESIQLQRRVERDEVSGEPLPAVNEDEGEPVLAVTVFWAFEGRPDVLVVRAPLVRGPRPPELGFMAWHLGIPVSDFRYLPGEATLDLNWDDPWFSRFRHRNLRRQYESPLNVFLYVEPFEVRKEVVLRPKDLETFLDFGIEGAEILTVEAQVRVKERVAAFLAERCPVEIDGVQISPVLDRIHFIRRTLRTTTVIDPPEDLPYIGATLGVIYAYPVDDWPQEVSMQWDIFPPRVEKIPAGTVDEAGGLPTSLTPEDPVLQWKNFLTNPSKPGLAPVERPPEGAGVLRWIAIVLAGLFVAGLVIRLLRARRPRMVLGLAAGVLAGFLIAVVWPARPTLSDEKAHAVVGTLLENVYRSFDVRGEERAYDLLARSVDGDLLSRVYLEAKRSLVLASQGGARVRVMEVTVEQADAEPLDDADGYRVRARWTVNGSVGHWGHTHQRRNAYEAILEIQNREHEWKITALELLDERRL